MGSAAGYLRFAPGFGRIYAICFVHFVLCMLIVATLTPGRPQYIGGVLIAPVFQWWNSTFAALSIAVIILAAVGLFYLIEWHLAIYVAALVASIIIDLIWFVVFILYGTSCSSGEGRVFCSVSGGVIVIAIAALVIFKIFALWAVLKVKRAVRIKYSEEFLPHLRQNLTMSTTGAATDKTGSERAGAAPGGCARNFAAPPGFPPAGAAPSGFAAAGAAPIRFAPAGAAVACSGGAPNKRSVCFAARPEVMGIPTVPTGSYPPSSGGCVDNGGASTASVAFRPGVPGSAAHSSRYGSSPLISTRLPGSPVIQRDSMPMAVPSGIAPMGVLASPAAVSRVPPPIAVSMVPPPTAVSMVPPPTAVSMVPPPTAGSMVAAPVAASMVAMPAGTLQGAMPSAVMPASMPAPMPASMPTAPQMNHAAAEMVWEQLDKNGDGFISRRDWEQFRTQCLEETIDASHDSSSDSQSMEGTDSTQGAPSSQGVPSSLEATSNRGAPSARITRL